MHSHKSEYQCIFETEKEMDEYIQSIERDSVWGGELEMAILSKIYSCAFIIHANGRPNISVRLNHSCKYRLIVAKIYKIKMKFTLLITLM
jgi:hypothetical protein